MNLNAWNKTPLRAAGGAALAVDRHEEKFLLSPGEAAYTQKLLDGLLRRDKYSAAGAYSIRSLYFDTPGDGDYLDKVLGVSDRCKVRLRIYDTQTPRVRLEIKQKSGVYSHKTGVWLTREEALALIGGDASPLLRQDTAAARRAWTEFARVPRRPSALIDYERTAWTMPVERVRITLDRHVRAAKSDALFDPGVPMLGVHSGGAVILEVKYDRYLPGYVRQALSTVGGQGMSISKYAAAREMLY